MGGTCTQLSTLCFSARSHDLEELSLPVFSAHWIQDKGSFKSPQYRPKGREIYHPNPNCG